LIEQAQDLVRAAGDRRGNINVSPETAALLEGIGGKAPEPVEAPATAPESGGILEALEAEVAGCQLCGLHETRTKTVFGEGNPNADIVFVGEAPGADEDRQGVPFVGRAGQLLTRIIKMVMGMERREVYICNVLKCRPPGNRDPQPREKDVCMPYLVRQLEQIQPKVICCLGKQAGNTLLDNQDSTGRMRGHWHFWRGIPLRVTYHPAYILRKEGTSGEREEKMKVKDDIEAVLRVARGEESPQPPGGSQGDLV
jgi:DNA polymerase